MGFPVACGSLLLHLLLILCLLQLSLTKESKQMNEEVSIKDKSFQFLTGNGESSMTFFTMEDLKVGKKMPIYFSKKDPSTFPHFLPGHEAASSIPISLKDLPNLLKLFSISQGSPQAKAIENTLKMCGIEPVKGEAKLCTTSLESMLDFARGVFGLDSNFSVLTTNFLTHSKSSFQNYTILDVPKEIIAPKIVACHTIPYPYSLYYCQYQENKNKVYKVLLDGENGDKVEAVSAFRVLRIARGTAPVCNFFPADNLIMVPKPMSD
ncbi:hypothetical protein UlMin_032387 [Ulmus minor]